MFLQSIYVTFLVTFKVLFTRDFLTVKPGKFYFSAEYDSSQIDSLLVRATVLNETIADLPILPELASQIEPDIMYSSISGIEPTTEPFILTEELICELHKIITSDVADSFCCSDEQNGVPILAAKKSQLPWVP